MNPLPLVLPFGSNGYSITSLPWGYMTFFFFFLDENNSVDTNIDEIDLVI